MITVLYVDDEPALLDIAKRFLEKNSEFQVYTALSAEEGLKMVLEKRPQAIVSDYQMPGMNGMAFLIEIRKTSSVPFIMFTGRGSEMIAMEATNSGADYYIQKGADPRALFAELTYKLRLAVSDRKSETEEQRMKKTIRTLIDKTYSAVIIHGPDGRIYDVNNKLLDLFGITRDEALKMNISDLSGSDILEMSRTEILKKVLAGEDQFLIWEAKRPHDDSLIKIEIFFTRINFGQNIYILCNIRDITGREQIMDIDKAILFAINNISEGVICTDKNGRMIFINSTWVERLKVDPSNLIGQQISVLDPSMIPEVIADYLEKANGKDGYTFRSYQTGQDGGAIPVENIWRQFSHDGKEFVCIFIKELSIQDNSVNSN